MIRLICFFIRPLRHFGSTTIPWVTDLIQFGIRSVIYRYILKKGNIFSHWGENAQALTCCDIVEAVYNKNVYLNKESKSLFRVV